jgi:methylated-DNA-protein-cysteine methyltransferase-like protein
MKKKSLPKVNKTAGGSTAQLKKITPSGKAEHSFFDQVYQLVQQVPKGRVTTYGAIAKALGSGLSARMVGWAMNGSHSGVNPVPAHRVVNRNGQLTGKIHFGSATEMQELLENEGIAVENDTVINFRELFWDPANEL